MTTVEAPSIVVGCDGSPESEHAITWAMTYADAFHGRLTVVTAWDWPVVEGAAVTYGDYDPAKAARDHALTAAHNAGLEIEPKEIVVEKGRPTRALLDHAAKADLLVVGSHGWGRMSRLMLGSVSNGCVHHSPVPVVVTRARSTVGGRPPSGVVVGFDDSPESRRALGWAIDYAERLDEQLIVVMVLQLVPPPMPIRYAAPLSAVHVSDQIDLTRDWLTDVVAKEQAERGRTLRSAPRIRVLEGSPSAVLVQQSSNAALTVVGSRGSGGFRRMLLGSTSSTLVNHAESPVAVIRPRPDEPH